MISEDIRGSVQVAILGGTFDPTHLGHLLIAEYVRRALAVPQVLFMPSGVPPHKLTHEVSPAEDRYVMAVLATADNPHFAVSRLEIDRPGVSYTIDTVRELNERFGAPRSVAFVTGADSIVEMGTWREPDAILEEALVVAAPRPGFDLGLLEECLGVERAARVTTLDVPEVDISSTEVRWRIAAGESARYLCPRPVLDYIRKRGLYL